MKFVIDMMGGDNGLKATIPSMQEFIKKYSDVEYFLVGDVNKLSEFNNLKNVHLVASETVLPMDADPLTALKETTSSLMVSIKTFLENKCDALSEKEVKQKVKALEKACGKKVYAISAVAKQGLFDCLLDVNRYITRDRLKKNQAQVEETQQTQGWSPV